MLEPSFDERPRSGIARNDQRLHGQSPIAKKTVIDGALSAASRAGAARASARSGVCAGASTCSRTRSGGLSQ
jgi:hypothetical protein